MEWGAGKHACQRDHMAAMYDRIEDLSPEELQTLAARLSASALPEVESNFTSGVPRPDRLPLSFAQERLWFLEQLESLGTAYNLGNAFRLLGHLDVAALERSLRELVRRHEGLRTRFYAVDGQGVQQIGDGSDWHLERPDAHALLAGAMGRDEWINSQLTRPLDLSKGSFRVGLVRLADQEHLLLVNMHHIITDGWSFAILIRELNALYTAYVRKELPSLARLEVQYADYALWQRRWLQAEVLERQLSYWRRQLAGIPAALELPTDYPRPQVPSSRGARHTLALRGGIARELRDLARREGVTLYVVLLAAFQVVLGRWSNQQDVTVGSPSAGRTQRLTEGLIGIFVNTLVMRTDLSGDPPFRDLLQRVRETALGAYAHEEVPFEKLVAELQTQRDMSRQAIFQVMF